MSPVELADILKRIRKISGITQVELSQKLGLEQAALSRVENGIQGVSISMIMKYAEIFGLLPESILNGQINFWDLGRRYKSKLLKVPQMYLQDEFTSVREFLPLFDYIENKKGSSALNKILDKLDLSDLTYMSPNEKIGTRCFLEFLSHSIEEKYINKRSINKITQYCSGSAYHGDLFAIYQNKKSPIEVLSAAIINEPYHNSVFQTKIKKIHQESLSVNYGVSPSLEFVVREYDDRVIEFLACMRNQYASQVPAQFEFDALNSNFEEQEIKDYRQPFVVDYQVAYA